jgi:hypothetical protein
MKTIKQLFILLACSSILSCSKSSDSNPSTDNPAVDGSYFNLNYNNAPFAIPSYKVERDGDYFRLFASKTPNSDFNLVTDLVMLFHKDGTLIKTTFYDTPIQSIFTTSYYFSKDTFTLNIENIDEVNKKIKFNFNGKLFTIHERNFNGLPFKNINGAVLLPYANISATTNSFAKNETTMLIIMCNGGVKHKQLMITLQI